MIEAASGARITVRDEPINRDNAFWAPLIGRSGIIIDIAPDGLFDLSIEGDVVVGGVKRERVCVFAASPFGRRPWWRRIWMLPRLWSRR